MHKTSNTTAKSAADRILLYAGFKRNIERGHIASSFVVPKRSACTASGTYYNRIVTMSDFYIPSSNTNSVNSSCSNHGNYLQNYNYEKK